MLDKFPKFIIEDGKLIFMKVKFHHEIATDKNKVKGGGWFRYDSDTNTFIFSGESYDFGKASKDDIEKCIEDGEVYSDNRLYRNVSKKHNFSYDTDYEIIELQKIV